MTIVMNMKRENHQSTIESTNEKYKIIPPGQARTNEADTNLYGLCIDIWIFVLIIQDDKEI